MNHVVFDKVFEELTILMNVDITDEKTIMVLGRALLHGDIDSYIENPKSPNDDCHNEIIKVRAESYFRRIMLPIDTKPAVIHNIRNYEHYKIHNLKAKMVPPPIKIKKQ